MSVATTLGVVGVACATAELIGYALHRVMHSERVPWLSNSHMRHHLVDYAPGERQRTPSYLSGARDRANIGSLGMEWFVPSTALCGLAFGLGMVAGLGAILSAVFVVTMIVWAIVMFAIMHAAIHTSDAWPLRIPGMAAWFRRARRLHYLHHFDLEASGRMTRNFGICVFWFDHVFRTFVRHGRRIDPERVRFARERFAPVVEAYRPAAEPRTP